MESDKEEMIAQFSAVAGVDDERSKFFLESSGWKLETALSSFYEESEDTVQPAEAISTGASAQGPSMPKLSMNLSDDSSSDGEGEAYYAGGSVNSGQQVLGPKKKRDVVSKLFKSAKEHGAEVMDPKDYDKKGSSSKRNTFGGTGYKLGETEDDHQVVHAGFVDARPSNKQVVLKMWKNGFTIDDGSLRGYQDTENQEFLQSIRIGKIPDELVQSLDKRAEISIDMEDHRREDYVEPKKKMKVFGGEGNTLGNMTPEVIGQVVNTGMPGGASGSSRISATYSEPVNLEQKAKDNLTVDASLPTTSIQLRLPDGGRLVLKLNHNHTVGDLRQYATTARPSLPATFALMTTFPYAELKDDSQTLVEAKLLNSSIVIK